MSNAACGGANNAMFIHKISSGTRSRLQNSQEIHSIAKAVEELVYNAIDSEATSIAVRVHLQSYAFQVIDNGVGIQPSDIPYVGKKHYTSKIFTVSDLRQPPVKYGYKGVTLAKLVSVSETLTITSRYALERETWMKSYHKGKEDVKVVEDRVSKGTTIHIQGFLYNLKIQRQSINGPKELQEIKNFLERTSILHTNISFSLRDDSDRSVLLGLHKSKDIYQAIHAAFGLELRDKMYELEVKKNAYSLKAFISKMVSDINLQLVFINGRLSVDSKLDSIVKNGFDKLIGNDIRITVTKTQKRNNDPIYPKAQGTLQYLIFLTCPYEDYQFDNRTQRTIIEFDHWEPISKILDKMIIFYRETLNDTDKRKDDIITHKDNEANVKEKVGEIVSRILRSHKNKIGLSQVQNGIRGKVAKRKKIKSSKHSNRKKASITKSNQANEREEPQKLKTNSQNERPPGQNLPTTNDDKQYTEARLQALTETAGSDKQEIKDTHYRFEQNNKMFTKLGKTQANNKHDKFLSKKTEVSKTPTRKILPNMDIRYTQEHRNIEIHRKCPRETDQNLFEHRNTYYCQDYIATKSVIRKRDVTIPKADNQIQENKIISLVSTVKTYESHCCDTHQKGVAISNKNKHTNKKKYQFYAKYESPCIQNRSILPHLKFAGRGSPKNIYQEKLRTNVDLQRKRLRPNKRKSEIHHDNYPMKYISNSRHIKMLTSAEGEINFDNELTQKKFFQYTNLKHPHSWFHYDYDTTGNYKKQRVICNSGESSNLAHKYMTIDSTIRSKTSSFKLVSHTTKDINDYVNYCFDRNDFMNTISPNYSDNKFLRCDRSNNDKDYSIYFNRGINVSNQIEYSKSPYFRYPECDNVINKRRPSKNFQFTCNTINWNNKEKCQKKSHAPIKSYPLDGLIDQDVKLIRNGKDILNKCLGNTLGRDLSCCLVPRAKYEHGIPDPDKNNPQYIKEPRNIIRKSNVSNLKELNVNEKISENNLNKTYTVEEENDLNQDFISEDIYTGNDSQLISSSNRLNPDTFDKFEHITQNFQRKPNEATTCEHKRYPQREEIIFISQECGRSSQECCIDPVTLCVPQLESSELCEESLNFEINSSYENKNHHKSTQPNSEVFGGLSSFWYDSRSEIVNEKCKDLKVSHHSIRKSNFNFQNDDFKFQNDKQNDCRETNTGISNTDSFVISNKKNDLIVNNKHICESSKFSHNEMTNNQVANTTYIISEHTYNEFHTAEFFSDSINNLHTDAILNSKGFMNARIMEISNEICANALEKDSIDTLLETKSASNTMTDENLCWKEIGTGDNGKWRPEDKPRPTQSENNQFIFRKRRSYVPKGYSQLMEKRVFFTPVLEPSQDYFNESVYEEFVDEVARGEEVVRGAIGPEAVNCGPRGPGTGARPPPGAVALDHTALAQAQVIGQVDRKFIALAVRAGPGAGAGAGKWLAMVDQHAAHERVRVHQLLREYKRRSEWVSAAVEGWEAAVSGEEAAALRCGRQLRALGLRWQLLGPHRVRLTAVPLALLGHKPRDREAVRSAAAALLREQARSLRQQRGAGDAHPPAIMRMLNSEACQSAIRFGQALSAAQCAALVSQLARCPLPFQCAHGRPTVALMLPLSDTPHHAYTVKTSQLVAFKRNMTEARIVTGS